MRRIQSFARLGAALLFGLVLVACGPGVSGDGDDDDDGDDDPMVDANTNNGDGDIPATEQCRKMDLIFVVDDSGSMELEQTNLATNFPQFAELLNSYTISTGEQLDYRAAVTTTGVTASGTDTVTLPVIPGFPPLPPISTPISQTGPNGVFRIVSGMPRAWLERNDPNMVQTFGQLAAVGTGGPATEMPLRAMELSIQPGTNPGFVRDDALLGVIMLTDEDDCSFRQTSGINIMTPPGCSGSAGIPAVNEFVASLDTVKGERGRWAAAVIAGQTSCTSSFGEAAEGVRLKQFQTAGGTNVVFGDICAGNLQGALMQALDSFQAACDSFPPID